MTAKQYLSQVQRLNRMISNKLSEIYQLKTLACNISVINEGTHVQTSSDNDKIGNMVASIVDLENETEKHIQDFIKIRKKIISQIDNITDNRYYSILFGRYIENKSFEDIADGMGYSWRQVMRLHNEAVENFERIYGKEFLSLNVIYGQ